MKLSVKAFAFTGGVLWGVSMLLMTFFVLFIGDGSNEMLSSFSDFYIGYTISTGGAFVGLIYGFFDGLIGCAIFAWLYNKFTK